MILRTAGILLKKEAREFRRDLTGSGKSSDIPGKLLSLALAAAIVAFTCFVLKRFAEMYMDIEINRVSAPYSRLYELTTAIYAVLILVNALGGVRTINRSIFGSGDLRIFVTLPVSSGAMYLSKMAVAYFKQFVFGFFTVLPVNVTLATCLPLGAQFYGMTALILVLMPLISLAVGSVFALPVYALTRAISSRYVISLVVATAVTGVAFWLYSEVLDFIANLISTGDARYFFDAETMREIARVTNNLFPASCFADMLLTSDMPVGVGWVLLLTAGLTAAGVLIGRLMLIPAAQDRLFSLNSRHVYKGHGMPAPRSVFLSFMKKEFVQVLRTPSYAFRYFSTAIIMPLMVYFCMDIFSELVGMLVLVNCDMEIAVFLIVMFGILTNTYCAGNISRDGEFFFTMKTLPVNYRTVIGAKVAFCFIGSAIPTAVSVGLVGGLGYVEPWQAVYLLFVTLAVSVAQICFATRRDLGHPRFVVAESASAEEGDSTVSVLVIIGLLVSVVIGVVALYDGIYLKLTYGEAYGETASVASVAVIAVALLAASLVYLFVGLDKKYREVSGGAA